MRWYSFFVPELGAKNVKALGASLWLAIFLLPVFFLSPEPGLSAEVPAVSTSPATTPGTSAASAEFLSLPVFDIQWDGISPKVDSKVGDSLPLKIMGVRTALPTGEPTLVPSAGAEELSESGWGIEPSAASSGTSTGADYSFLAIALKEGQLTLPALMIQDSAGKAVGRTRPFSVSVNSAIRPDDPKPKEVAPPEPPVGLKFPVWVVVAFVFFASLGLAALGYFAYRAWKKYQKKTFKPIPVVIRPEDEEALALLAQVEHAGYIQKAEFKSYYFRISEILKFYFGRRYRFDALECTTGEMLRILESKSAVDDLLLDEIEENFNLLDRVKFTTYIPETEECVKLLDWGRSFILRTRKPKQTVVSQNNVPSENTPRVGGPA